MKNHDGQDFETKEPNCYECGGIGMINYADYMGLLTHSIILYCDCYAGKRLIQNDPNREELNRINASHEKFNGEESTKIFHIESIQRKKYK